MARAPLTVALSVLYVALCWALVAWGTYALYGHQPPWPWIGAALLEAPSSLLVVLIYGVLVWVQPGLSLGAVMGHVLVLVFVFSAPLNLALWRWLRRRFRRSPRADTPG